MASDNFFFFSIFLPFLFNGKWTIQYPVKGITFMNEKSSLNMMNKLRVCNKKMLYCDRTLYNTWKNFFWFLPLKCNIYGLCKWMWSRCSNWIKICIIKIKCWRKLLPRWKHNLSRFFKGLVSLVTRYFQISSTSDPLVQTGRRMMYI